MHDMTSPHGHNQSHGQHSHSSSSQTKRDHAFEVILNENRALKNEIEVYKQGISTLNVEKDDLERDYEQLKSKVTDVTTQLRIMTRRYNKIKNKNEEYKKHFQNTLTIRLSAQQATISNYHNQLTQIKEKYDILYNEYLDKNNIIKDWEAKYHRLANDFDEFVNNNGSSTNNNGSSQGNNIKPSTLVKQCKVLKNKLNERDENLNYLAQIISSMYNNSLPIIQQTLHNQTNRDDDEDDDDDEEDEDEDEDEDGDGDDENDDDSIENEHDQLQISHHQQMNRNMNMNYLNVNQHENMTPPNSSYVTAEEEEDEDSDEYDDEDDGSDDSSDDDEQKDREENDPDFDEDVDNISVEDMVDNMVTMHPVIYHGSLPSIPTVGRGTNINGQESAMKEVENLLPNILGPNSRNNKHRGSINKKVSKKSRHKNKKKKGKKHRNDDNVNGNIVNVKFTSYRHDSHMNDGGDGNQDEEELMDSENEREQPQHQRQQRQRKQNKRGNKSKNNVNKGKNMKGIKDNNISLYASNNNLSAPTQLKNRSLSEISIDEDGVDKRDDDELEHQLGLNPIKLPPKVSTNTRSRPSYHKMPKTQSSPTTASSVSTLSQGKSSPPPPSVASSTGSVTKKKRYEIYIDIERDRDISLHSNLC